MLPRDNDKIPQDFTKSKEYFLFLKSLNKNIDFTTTQHKFFTIVLWKNAIELKHYKIVM